MGSDTILSISAAELRSPISPLGPDLGVSDNRRNVHVLVQSSPEAAGPSRWHFARFDVGIMQAYLGIVAAPLYCTRTASRLVRTYTDRHGLKDLVKELLNIDLSKQQQSSDWVARR